MYIYQHCVIYFKKIILVYVKCSMRIYIYTFGHLTYTRKYSNSPMLRRATRVHKEFFMM